MTTAANPKSTKEETGRKTYLPGWAKFPKCTPTVLIAVALLAILFVLANVLNIVTKVFLALHGSSLPWWAVFFAYAFVGGALFRASKEFGAWTSAAKNRWGVFTRWAKALV